MNAICLVTFRPNKIWCDFLDRFSNYKIFIIVDDNHFDLSDFLYENIVFVKVEDEKCILNGYINSSFTLKKIISGWDKALYYFAIEENEYEFVWFLEDDVFFYDENTIIQIDKQYSSEDLLSNSFKESIDANKNEWHWNKIDIEYPPPYYYGMMCIVRFSRKMISSINDYAYENNVVFFLESLFPTIAIKNRLIYANPIEFNNIFHKYNFENEDIDKNNLYHPVKELDQHIYYRTI